MKVLVFAHRLEIGGTQVNALELGAALRDLHGHDVVLFASPGPMAALAAQLGLRLIEAPDASRHPSRARSRALQRVITDERPDVLHVWDWPQCLDALYSWHDHQRVPMVVTDMSMVLSRYLPKSLPTTFGTPELVDQAKADGRHPVELLLPPVDIHLNAPGAVGTDRFRQMCGVGEQEVVLVTVSRLTEWMKAEGIRRIMDALLRIGHDAPIRYLVVGEGTARPDLETHAEAVNAELGRQAILMAGPLLDPREAYAAADVVAGMGGSALRALAFAKPLLVLGEGGFSAPFDASTAEWFYYHGMYGLGDGDDGNHVLERNLRSLLLQPDRFGELGQFGRDFVTSRFAVEAVAAQLASLLEAVVREEAGHPAVGLERARTAALLAARAVVPLRLRRRFAEALAYGRPQTTQSVEPHRPSLPSSPLAGRGESQ